MSIFHVGKLAQVPTLSLLIIVALKAQEDCLSALIPTFLALQQECKKNGKLYIKSLRGGRQISKEQWHGKLNVVFLFGFASQNDLDYYIDQDEKHQPLKVYVLDSLG